MDLFQTALPLIGVIIGSLLTGIGAYLRSRIERKRTIALALTDLLEVRHHITGIDVVLKEIRRRFNVPAEASFILQTFIEQMFPVDADVHKRYDSAVSILAGIDPLLAFNLRSKNTLPALLSSIRGAAETAGLSMDGIDQVESTLRLSLAPRLDDAVIELAGKHSFVTKRKVKKIIARSGELPPEVNAIFDRLMTMQALNDQKQKTS